VELRRATRRGRAALVVDAAVCLAVALLLAGVVGESDPGPPWGAIGTAAAVVQGVALWWRRWPAGPPSSSAARCSRWSGATPRA
jgi:hypothetical protein